jgi:excinuclease ABC subunit B
MEGAAKDLDFLQAAKYRDELTELRKLLKTK